MINIVHKSTTHRTAIAQAVVRVQDPATIRAVIENRVPKGNVFECARTAGLLAAKRTSELIPDCHPLPIEYAGISFETSEVEIVIRVEIQTVYKTGVEVEAMHAASVVALTVYDMLKPIDKQISIERIHLIEKHGGKSDFIDTKLAPLSAAVIVCSDSISQGHKKDSTGTTIVAKLQSYNVEVAHYVIIPDEAESITAHVREYCAANIPLIIITGGTGLSPRDVTPEVLEALIDKRVPGIEEAIRSYGQQRTPYSMLSRSVAGFVADSLVLALPGSVRGAAESMDAVFPQVLHVFRVKQGARHD